MANWKVTKYTYELNSPPGRQPRFIESSTFITSSTKQAFRRFACYRYEAEVLADQYHKLHPTEFIFSYTETQDLQFHQIALGCGHSLYAALSPEEQELIESYVDHLRQCIN